MNKSLAKLRLNTTEGESFIFEPPTEHLQAVEPSEAEDLHKKGKMQAYRLLCEGLARIRYTDRSDGKAINHSCASNSVHCRTLNNSITTIT